MTDDVARQLFDKINLLLVDVSTIKANFDFYMKLDHEPRVRALEVLVTTLIRSVEALTQSMDNKVEALVQTVDNKKESSQYIITTTLAAAALLIAVYAALKH